MKAKQHPLFKIVADRPTDDEPTDAACPCCRSESVRQEGETSTSVGCFPGEDPNHHRVQCWCEKCGQSFTKEWKYKNVWYTSGGKVLRGMPSCFESYVYRCLKCDGDVRREYTELDGETKAVNLMAVNEGKRGRQKWVRKYRTFYSCSGCGKRTEVEDEYWLGPGLVLPKGCPWPMVWRLRKGWTIHEEPGVCVINGKALGRIDFRK